MNALAQLARPEFTENLDKLIVMGGGILVALVAILTCFIRGIVRTRAREQTKRELAAYVAEGSMKPEDAERIIKADLPKWERC